MQMKPRIGRGRDEGVCTEGLAYLVEPWQSDSFSRWPRCV